MTHRIFPGYPAYLETAADRLECPASAGPAARISLVAALANLCAQATAATPAQLAAIRVPAYALYDQLRVATLAARLMLADLEAETGEETAASMIPQADRPATTRTRRKPRGRSTP
jgi:hypothetical protein